MIWGSRDHEHHTPCTKGAMQAYTRRPNILYLYKIPELTRKLRKLFPYWLDQKFGGRGPHISATVPRSCAIGELEKLALSLLVR